MHAHLSSLVLLASLGVAVGVANAGFNDLFKSAGDLLKEVPAASTGGAASTLSESEISAGLKQALSLGAEQAVEILGRQGGFLNDSSVRIPLPGMLDTAAKGLRAAGQGQYVEDFEVAVNRAAEQAIPQTLDIVENTVSNMSLQDVRGILTGSDDAATRYLREHAGAQLHAAILPIVSRTTDSSGATSAYKSLVKESGDMLGGLGSLGGLVNTGSFDLDSYIADKTLDGFFLKLADQEKLIREDPAARTTTLLKQVFSN